MPTITINGKTHTPILSPIAVRDIEQDAKKPYPVALMHAVDQCYITDLLIIAAAVLRVSWPEVTPDLLWEAYQMQTPAKMTGAVQELRTMIVDLLGMQMPSEESTGDEKNG
jgi:hypothetical protein